jgi:hypothetical protein
MTSMALDAAWRFAHVCVIAPVRLRLQTFCSTRNWQTKKNGAEIMENIIGKHIYTLNATDFTARLHGYQQIVMDIGTGDGRYVTYFARRSPE